LVLKKVDQFRLVLLSLVVLTMIGGFNGLWRAEADSALYLTIAKNLATGHGYTYNGVTNDLAYPGLPFLLAGVFKIFGTDSLVPANALMLVLGLVALALNYRLFKLLGGRPLAVVMTLGLGFTRTFYRYAFQIMTDMPFLVGVLAFFAGYESLRAARRDALAARRDARAGVPEPHKAGAFDWALMVVGLLVVVVTRPAMYAFIPVVAVALLIGMWRTVREPGRRVPAWTWLLVGSGIASVIALMLHLDPRAPTRSGTMGQYEEFVVQQFTTDVDQTASRMVHENVPHLLNEIAADALFGIEFGTWLTPVFSVVVLALGLVVAKKHPVWGLWVGLTVATMVLIQPVDRYLLPVLPMLIFGWWTTLSWLNHHIRRPLGDVVFGVLLVLGMSANLTKVGAIAIDQHRSDFYAHYKEGRFGPLSSLAREIRTHVAPDDVVLAPSRTARVLTFWSGRNVTEWIEYSNPDVKLHRVWVAYDPVEREKSLDKWVPSLRLVSGPAVASVPRPGEPPLTLHPTTRY